MDSSPPPDPPSLALKGLIAGYRHAQAIYVAAKLGLADLLTDGPLDVDELARRTATDAGALRRLLRALAGLGLFLEETVDGWSVTTAGDLLRSNVPGSLRQEAILYGEPWSWRPWGELLWSVQTGEAAFPHVFGVNRFDYLAAHPDANAVFNAAMSADTATGGDSLPRYDFSDIGTLVDVGGGQGSALVALLRANPGMRGVLFDQPHVVAGAAAHLAAAGVTDRCTVVGGDFFREAPSGGDAYFLRHILHNWSDRHAQTVLAVCRRAIAPHGRLLVEDLVIEAGPDRSDPLLLDLHMLVAHGGRERTADEFRDLLAATGFDFRAIHPGRGALRLLEAVPV